MPRNDYRCRNHGLQELWFEKDPPRECPLCGEPVVLVIATNQFTLGGDMTVLKEPFLRSVEMQLGERVETREDLRALEERKGVRRIDAAELMRSDSPTWKAPKSDAELARDAVPKAVEAAKKAGTYPT